MDTEATRMTSFITTRLSNLKPVFDFKFQNCVNVTHGVCKINRTLIPNDLFPSVRPNSSLCR